MFNMSENTQSAAGNFGEDLIVQWSKPEEERAGTPLLVMFHGYGSNEADLIGLAPHLPEEFTIASLRAPMREGMGYKWFSLVHTPDYSFDQVKNSVNLALKWLDEVKANHSKIVLFGFSMGMAMATSLLRRRPDEYEAVIGCSGFAIDAHGDDFFNDAAVAERKPPMFWGRDQQDPVITQDKVEYTNEWSRAHVDLTKINYSNMMHSISAQEIAHINEYLRVKVLSA